MITRMLGAIIIVGANKRRGDFTRPAWNESAFKIVICSPRRICKLGYRLDADSRNETIWTNWTARSRYICLPISFFNYLLRYISVKQTKEMFPPSKNTRERKRITKKKKRKKKRQRTKPIDKADDGINIINFVSQSISTEEIIETVQCD